jgi:hypothetical protein
MIYLGVNLTYPLESVLPSYDFEILHGFLNDQNNKISTLIKLISLFTPHYDIFGGELNISS